MFTRRNCAIFTFLSPTYYSFGCWMLYTTEKSWCIPKWNFPWIWGNDRHLGRNTWNITISLLISNITKYHYYNINQLLCLFSKLFFLGITLEPLLKQLPFCTEDYVWLESYLQRKNNNTVTNYTWADKCHAGALYILVKCGGSWLMKRKKEFIEWWNK